MKKKALLVVSFGTSYPDSLKNSIEATELALAADFPDHDLKRAFTSRIVIRKLAARDGIHVDTPREALQMLLQDGCREVVVQPLHIIAGIEYRKMLADLQPFADRFDRLSVGRPLLGDPAGFDEIVAALTKCMPVLAADEAWVWMGHGSPHAANSAYAGLEAVFQRRGMPVWIATVEGTPTLADILPRLEENSIRRVNLQPLMLVAGDHAYNDMAGAEEDSWRSVLERAGYEVNVRMTGLGELPEIQRIFAAHVTAARQGDIP